MATLERLRGALEDIEEIDRLVVAELDGSTAKTQREQITSDHKLAAFLRATQERARTCLDIYKDEDGLKKAEVAAMSGPAALSNFYDQLRSTKDYHRRFRDAAAALPPLKDQLERDADAEGKFSGEESMGRYVDLNAFYQRFVNLPGNRRHAKLDYRSYLDLFADFQRQGVPVAQKRAVYTKYVADLGDYLRGFHARCNPLADTDELAARAEEEFAKTLSLEGVQEKPGFLDLSGYSSVQELEALGLERLKAALQALALKCGGSLQERAARLFRAKGRSPAELLASADSAHSSSVLGKKKKKRSRKRKAANGGGGASDGGGGGAAAAGNGDGGGDAALRRDVAQREFLVGFYERLLANTVKNTKQYTETRQIRTYEELAAEQVAQEEAEALRAAAADGADGDSDDEEAPTYNPLNLPLGWDGKPIPFWLYKLHGLGEEFKCEICGNESYWGRRAFDRHFQESRHSYGMRCLGIPNTKHFHDITLIEDARALYAKMQGAVSKETWVPDEQEEFEDSEGNVFDKKTYEDLAKQGLL